MSDGGMPPDRVALLDEPQLFRPDRVNPSIQECRQRNCRRCLELPANGQTSYINIAERNLLGASVEKSNNADPELLMADLTDDQVRDWAESMLETLGLPRERLPVVQRHGESERAIAKEKSVWCGHLELLQHLGHTRRKSTCYLVDPKYVCRCGRYGYETMNALTGWYAVISRFKQVYCAGCPGRAPRQGA